METGLLNILWRKVIMKLLKYIVFTWITFASCTTSKDYLSRIDEDKALFDAVKALGKHSVDTAAAKAIPVLYTHALERHQKIIEGYKNSREPNRWTQIIDEYSKLQKMYDAFAETEAANRLVTAVNFQSTIYDLKQQAAEDYYNEANAYLAKQGKEDAKKAYGYFKKADKWADFDFDAFNHDENHEDVPGNGAEHNSEAVTVTEIQKPDEINPTTEVVNDDKIQTSNTQEEVDKW